MILIIGLNDIVPNAGLGWMLISVALYWGRVARKSAHVLPFDLHFWPIAIGPGLVYYCLSIFPMLTV